MTETVATDRKTPSLMEPYAGLAFALLLTAAVVPVMQIFVSQHHFILRGDDAFYYFEVALNYAELGFWTFDGTNPTNGVQPLWAIFLSGYAVLLDLAGVSDKQLIARFFVGLCVLLNIVAAFLLFDLLRKVVSTGTGVAAAGAFLLPLGIVWQRSWGMENSLYALMLIASVYWYHLRFRPAPSVAGAAILGLLLGLLALARLNAGLFAPILVAHFLFFTRDRDAVARLLLACVAGLVGFAIILPYLAFNLTSTGHLMPISGAAKPVYGEYMALHHSDASPLSLTFWREDDWKNLRHLTWFATSRIGDGLWMLGSRYFFEFQSAVPEKRLLLALAFLTLLPMTCRPEPREWFAFLYARLRALGAFWYVLVFGFVDFLLSVGLYSQQLSYSVTRWWWVENEIILVTLSATLGTAVLSFLGTNLIRGSRYPRLLVFVPLSVLVAHQISLHVQHFRADDRSVRDWNLSGNEAWFEAAQWLKENVPQDEVVGGWNAGVLGYYSVQPVVNLDGLINNFEYLDYMRDGRVEDYVEEKGIAYLADMESMFEIYGIPEKLDLEPVYRKRSEFYRKDFVVYRVIR